MRAFSLIALVAATPAGAQPGPPEARFADTVRVAVRLDAPADTLSMGVPFDVRASIAAPSIDRLGLVTPEGAFAPLELVGVRRELDRGDSARVVVTLRPFAVGPLTLPPLVFAGRLGDTLAIAVGESLRVRVASIVPADAWEIRDLREPRPPVGPDRFRLFALVALALLLLALVLWRVFRRRVGDDAGRSFVPADALALEALGRLGASPLARDGPWKAFYTELTDVLRRYLGRRFGVEATDLTTTETLRAIGGLDLPDAARTSIAGVLRAADGVKFARESPEPGEVTRHLADAERFVRITAPEPEETPAPVRPAREGAR